MDKVLIEVYLPAADRAFDVLVPKDTKMHELTKLLSSMLSEMVKAFFLPSDDMVLCERSSGKPLDIDLSVQELAICNGTKLILI